MDILSVFVERLKELMDENNFNTLSIEKTIGIKNSSVSCWLNKQYAPSLKNLISLSKLFNCSVDFLLGRTDISEISNTTIFSCFTDRLKLLATEKKKTLHKIAKDLTIDDATLYNWGNGKYKPSILGLCLLADYFGCSVDYLIGREEID